MVTGSRPAGSARPSSTSARATPIAWPGSQAYPTAATRSAHGMSTGMPALTTTIVRGFTAETRRTSSSCRPGRASPGRSNPSLSAAGGDPTTSMAASAVRAASTASRSSASSSGAGTTPSRMATGPCGQSSGRRKIPISVSAPALRSAVVLISPGRTMASTGSAGVPVRPAATSAPSTVSLSWPTPPAPITCGPAWAAR